MAGLSSAFKTKGALFRAALKANDFDAMRALMKKKGRAYGWEMVDGANCQVASLDMITMILTETDAEGWKRWSTHYPEDAAAARQLAMLYLADTALRIRRLDILDAVLDAKPDFNSGKAERRMGDYHVIGQVIEADMPEEVKTTRLRKMLSGGCDKIDKPEIFLRLAADRNFFPGISLLAAAGADVHAASEQLLRNAAKNGQKDLCLYLIDTQKADLGLATKAAGELGAADVCDFLERLRPAAVTEEAPPTVESLSAQVKEMKAAIRELTGLVTALTAEKTLDKTPPVSVLKVRTP